MNIIMPALQLHNVYDRLSFLCFAKFRKQHVDRSTDSFCLVLLSLHNIESAQRRSDGAIVSRPGDRDRFDRRARRFVVVVVRSFCVAI
jgi:hypothetical protein